MIKVIGVRFRTAGKIYFFSPGGLELKAGDKVIVETARGVEFGSVVTGIKEVPDDQISQPLKPVIRIATQDDVRREAKNREKEKDAFKICQEKIRKHGLEMKLIDAEYTFDNNKVLFYFTADGRIDFRELVKDLASVFRTRIELRQIGVRDVNVLRQTVKVIVSLDNDEKEVRDYKVDELRFKPRRRKNNRVSKEEMKELRGLEEKNGASKLNDE